MLDSYLVELVSERVGGVTLMTEMCLSLRMAFEGSKVHGGPVLLSLFFGYWFDM